MPNAPIGAAEDYMDAALTATTTRRADSTVHVVSTTAAQAPQTAQAIATFRLSETGRKASLLAGGNGRQPEAFARRCRATNPQAPEAVLRRAADVVDHDGRHPRIH